MFRNLGERSAGYSCLLQSSDTPVGQETFLEDRQERILYKTGPVLIAWELMLLPREVSAGMLDCQRIQGR